MPGRGFRKKEVEKEVAGFTYRVWRLVNIMA
jgi:hypothetical protein